jgi:hypothetical protein
MFCKTTSHSQTRWTPQDDSLAVKKNPIEVSARYNKSNNAHVHDYTWPSGYLGRRKHDQNGPARARPGLASMTANKNSIK